MSANPTLSYMTMHLSNDLGSFILFLQEKHVPTVGGGEGGWVKLALCLSFQLTWLIWVLLLLSALTGLLRLIYKVKQLFL